MSAKNRMKISTAYDIERLRFAKTPSGLYFQCEPLARRRLWSRQRAEGSRAFSEASG